MRIIEPTVELVDDVVENALTYTECLLNKTFYAYASQSSDDIHYSVRNVYYAGGKIDGIEVRRDNGAYLIVWDGLFATKNEQFHQHMRMFRKTEAEFAAYCDVAKEMVHKTFLVTASLGTLMEFGVKKRFCHIRHNEICRPFWMSKKDASCIDNDGRIINELYGEADKASKDAIRIWRTYLDHDQDAANADHLLPMAVAATTLMTKSATEWMDFIKECNVNNMSVDACNIVGIIKEEFPDVKWNDGGATEVTLQRKPKQ